MEQDEAITPEPPGARASLADVVQVLWSPLVVMARVAAGGRAWVGLVAAGIVAAVRLLSVLVNYAVNGSRSVVSPAQLPRASPEVVNRLDDVLRVTIPVMTLLGPFLYWLGLAGLLYLAARVLGGRGTFAAMLAVVGLAMMPVAVSSLVGIPLTVIGHALGPASLAGRTIGVFTQLLDIVVLAWHAALVVVGLHYAQGLTYWQSGGACAASCVGCIGVFVLAALLFVIIAFVIGGSTQSTSVLQAAIG